MRAGLFLTLILGLLGVALVLLIVNHDGGQTLGMDNYSFASTITLGAWAAVIGAAVIGSGQRLGEMARHALVWLIIALVMVTGYLYRYDLQLYASRMTAGLVPGMPVARTAADGSHEVILHRSNNGHFHTSARVNGTLIDLLVDTGASGIALSWNDAETIGLRPQELTFNHRISTANGTSQAARVDIDTIEIGAIRRHGLDAVVLRPGAIDESLLGMNFLETLVSFEMSRDVLVLKD